MPLSISRLFTALYCFLLAYSFYDSVKPWTLDDAFISFRYAENWVHGHGLVYNPGEYVEGYTSFLWVALLALLCYGGIDTLAAAKALCVFFALLCFLGVMFSHRFITTLNKNESLIAALLLGTCGAFIPWSFSGMEVSLFCFLTVAAVLYALRYGLHSSLFNALVLGLLLSTLILCRPEGTLLAGLIVLYCMCIKINRTHTFLSFVWIQKLKSLHFIFLILLIIFTICAQYLIRYAYYGEWMPNTYYVKVGWTFAQLSRGWHYVYEFSWCVSAMLLFCVYAIIRVQQFKKDNSAWLMTAVIILFYLYSILVGGDSMPAFRFMVPAVPFLCLLTAKSISLLFIQQKQLMAILFLLIGFNAYQLNFNWHIHGHILSDRVALYGKEAGLWLQANLPPDAVIATNTAGSVAFYSQLHTLDMLGLTDQHIAHKRIDTMGQGSAGHEKGDGAYILSRKPDVIQFASSLGALQPMFRSETEMYAMPEFQEQYEPKTIGLPSGKDLALYFRKHDTEQAVVSPLSKWGRGD